MMIYEVTGGSPLSGSIRVQGSKNAVLPLLAASLLTPNVTVLRECPAIRDVEAATDILQYLGCETGREGHTLTLDTRTARRWDIPADMMHRMRSSVIFLGPLLARFGEARVCLPGGCELGPRPIDLHLRSLSRLGAEIREEGDCIFCRAKHLHGAEISLPLPSVGATENAMLAACAAEGETVIYNAAREPEIETLQTYLRSLGAAVTGAGTPVIRIGGMTPRDRAAMTVPADRIAAATYLCCAVCAGGEITLEAPPTEQLRPVTDCLSRMGCTFTETADTLHMTVPERLFSPGAVVTKPYPGFPTDAAPLLMAACLRAEGTTLFVENIFSDRYRHAMEMRRLGANIVLRGPTAMVTGVKTLRGNTVHSPDLRGGAALTAAALSAGGTSRILDPGHIRRGYEGLSDTLRRLGADIKSEDRT